MYRITVYENIHGEEVVKYTRTAKDEDTAKKFANSFKGFPNYKTVIEKVKEKKR